MYVVYVNILLVFFFLFLKTSKLVDDILGELQSVKKKVTSFDDLKDKVIFTISIKKQAYTCVYEL